MMGQLLTLFTTTSTAASHATSNTIDIQGGPFAGQTIPGMIIFNTPCAFGDTYHFQLNDEGVLSVLGPLTCHGSGGKQICYLGPELSCHGISELSTGATMAYVVNATGVVAGDKTYPWANQAQAVALFPSAKARAEKKCNEVLFWQAKSKEHGHTPSADKLETQEKCKPVLDQLCAASKGGPVNLSNGKDVTILCH
jgi:hypothetical protein